MIVSYTIPKHPPKRFETDSDSIIIGRRPSPDQHVDIDLDADEFVSRLHASITFEDGLFWVQDLGSANGTWVNGLEIQNKTALSPGTSIQIGYTIFAIQMVTEADSIKFHQDTGSTPESKTSPDGLRDPGVDRQIAVAPDLPDIPPESEPPKAAMPDPIPPLPGDQPVSHGEEATRFNPEVSIHRSTFSGSPPGPASETQVSEPPNGPEILEDSDHTTVNPDFSTAAETDTVVSPDPASSISNRATAHPSREIASTQVNPDFSVNGTPEESQETEDATLINPNLGSSQKKEPASSADETFVADIDGYLVDPVDMPLHSYPVNGKDTFDEFLMQGLHQLKALNEAACDLIEGKNVERWEGILKTRLQKIVPNAFQGVLILSDSAGNLNVQARWPEEDVPVSLTWARKAYESGDAFLWNASGDDVLRKDLPVSAACNTIRSALYVPLIAGPDCLGVVYAANPYDRDAFSAGDLELIKALACLMALILKSRGF